MFEEYKDHCLAAYAAYLVDDAELLSCASGGIGTALSEKFIRDGGYVAGVRYSDDFHSIKYQITNDVNDLKKFKGSKYAEVDKGTVYKDVKELLNRGERVLFFGLPCTVKAMHLFLKKDYDNLVTVELICHGPTSILVHKQYLEYLESRFNSKIVDFTVRRKEGKWTPPFLYAKFENGKVFKKEFYSTEYGIAFGSMVKPACYNCQTRGNNRTGDIMIGDYWGARPEDEFWNEKGISAVLVHTEKGEALLKSLPNVKMFDTSFESIVQGNLNIINPSRRSGNSKKFEEAFKAHGLFYAVKHGRTFKQKVKVMLSGLIPESLKPFARRVYHKIFH